MKLINLCCSTHLASAVISASIAITISSFSLSPLVVMALVVIGVVGCAVPALLLRRRILEGIGTLEKVVGKSSDQRQQKTHIAEFDDAVDEIRKHVRRWSTAAKRSREQMREFEKLADKLDNRTEKGSTNESPCLRIQNIVGGLTRSIDSQLEQLDHALGEIQTSFKQHASALEDQNETVTKTTTYVEQLSVNIASVSQHANHAEKDCQDVVSVANVATETIARLQKEVQRVYGGFETSESRLRSLSDRFREIGMIAETITEISSRTDMLALNVSIESVRAGTNSRGFSVVAEEVRKLAEQASQAAREVTGIVESIQLETQESTSSISQYRNDLLKELDDLGETSTSLEKVRTQSRSTNQQVSDIAKSAGQQIHLTRDLIAAVEKISKTSRHGRRRIEATSWGVNGLSTILESLRGSMDVLRRIHSTDETTKDTRNEFEGNFADPVHQEEELAKSNSEIETAAVN